MNREIKQSLIISYDKSAKDRSNRQIDEWKIIERNTFWGFLKKEEKQSLLDLGAGVGRDSKFFKDNDLKLVCIDISSISIETCKEKGLEAYVMDFYNLEFEDRKFDCIWSLNSLLHVPKKDISKVFEEMRRVLKPSSLIYIGTYGGYNFEGIWEEDTYEPKRFFSFYTVEEIMNILEKYFEIIYFKKIYAEKKKMDFYSIILRS